MVTVNSLYILLYVFCTLGTCGYCKLTVYTTVCVLYTRYMWLLLTHLTSTGIGGDMLTVNSGPQMQV